MVTLPIEALFTLPSTMVEDTLDFLATTIGREANIGEYVSPNVVYTSPTWHVTFNSDSTLTAYAKDPTCPGLSGVYGQMKFTPEHWKYTLVWLSAQHLSKASDGLAKKLTEMEAREKKLIAQLDHTKALLRHMHDLANGEGLGVFKNFLSHAWFNFEPQVTLAAEDWYNTDKSTIVQRYVDGDLNESAAMYLMETEDRLVLIRAVDVYHAANTPQGQK